MLLFFGVVAHDVVTIVLMVGEHKVKLYNRGEGFFMGFVGRLVWRELPVTKRAPSSFFTLDHLDNTSIYNLE